jgi:hypothetical protein
MARMPSKPKAYFLMLAAALLTVAGCSSGGSDTPDKTPSSGGKSSSTNGTKTKPVKLHKVSSKDGIKNVFAKMSSGTKISLYAEGAGHEVMEQIYDPEAKSWSKPTSVFDDENRFCHSIKMKNSDSLIAATVTCSISAQDKNGTQSSYVLASTDGKSWKRLDLDGVSGKPSLSPNGKFVAWTAPSSFLLWNPAGTFTTVKYQQSADAPAVAVMQDDGSLLIIKGTGEKHGFCVISFQTASAKAPAVKAINSTVPKPDHPHCVATSAKVQGTRVVANFQQTETTKDDNGKKVTKRTTFAYALKKDSSGHWIVVTS